MAWGMEHEAKPQIVTLDEASRIPELDRATRAVLAAPTAESGLVLPPHVHAEQEAKTADRQREEAGGPALNRAQRRENERRLRKIQKRDARLTARRTAEQVEAIENVIAATNELTPAQRKVATAFIESIKGLPLEEQRAAFERFRETGSLHAATEEER